MTNQQKNYPQFTQFYNVSEFNYQIYFNKSLTSNPFFVLRDLQQAHYLLTQYAEKLIPSEGEKFFRASRINYMAMTMFHLYIKTKKSIPKEFDLKLSLLSCLRISATNCDLELSQDKYTRIYYDSVIRDEMEFQKKKEGQTDSPIASTMSANYISYDKIVGKLRKKFLDNQKEIFEALGYGFNIITPFGCLERFHLNWWNEIKRKLNFENDKERKRKLCDILHRFILQVSQVIIDSFIILPIPLYFEPEEIVAAALGIASRLFKSGRIRFQLSQYSDQTKQINNQFTNMKQEDLKTGEEIWNQNFPGIPLIELDIEKNFMDLKTQQEMVKNQPSWFKYLICEPENSKKIDPHDYFISLHQVDLLLYLVLRTMTSHFDRSY